MPLTKLKTKFGNIVFLVTLIGATITLIGYIKPIINYVSDLNKLVKQYESINLTLERLDTHLKQYEEDRANKKKTFSIGLRSDTETGKIIYVDENNGIYRAFLDDNTNEYFYYDIDGNPIFCYTRKPVRNEQPHLEIRPLFMPDSVIVTVEN
jgi:hypothetical protein